MENISNAWAIQQASGPVSEGSYLIPIANHKQQMEITPILT